MIKQILDRLKEDILTADGAWGTLLQAKGLNTGECPEEWNDRRPQTVRSIAEEYLLAGAQIIKTNSFGANRYRLQHYSLQNNVFEIAKKAAEISRAAVGSNAYVFGSMGPTGKMLIMGEVEYEDILNTFTEQAGGLVAGGVDALLLETFSDLQELEAGIKAVKSVTSLPVITSVSFEKNADGAFRTMMGVDLSAFYDCAREAGADIIGTNCGNGFENMVRIIEELRVMDSSIPLLVFANAGLPVLEHGKIVYTETPEFIKPIIPKLIDAGANIIGGCCGTTPEHIRVIRQIISERK